MTLYHETTINGTTYKIKTTLETTFTILHDNASGLHYIEPQNITCTIYPPANDPDTINKLHDFLDKEIKQALKIDYIKGD